MNEAEQMLTTVLDCERHALFSEKIHLTTDQEDQLTDMIKRRVGGEPLQYVLGFTEFLGLRLIVDHRVLIPRPETEVLVDHAINRLKEKSADRSLKILDLGTGSGNIAISLAKLIPNSRIEAVDISLEALDVARENASLHDVDHQIKFIHDDMVQYLTKQAIAGGQYDAIISNPPYIPTEKISTLPSEVQLEPRIALDGGDDGLRLYRGLLNLSLSLLQDSGFVLLECWDDQAQLIKDYVTERKPVNVEMILDLTNIQRGVLITH